MRQCQPKEQRRTHFVNVRDLTIFAPIGNIEQGVKKHDKPSGRAVHETEGNSIEFYQKSPIIRYIVKVAVPAQNKH